MDVKVLCHSSYLKELYNRRHKCRSCLYISEEMILFIYMVIIGLFNYIYIYIYIYINDDSDKIKNNNDAVL